MSMRITSWTHELRNLIYLDFKTFGEIHWEATPGEGNQSKNLRLDKI